MSHCTKYRMGNYLTSSMNGKSGIVGSVSNMDASVATFMKLTRELISLDIGPHTPGAKLIML